jgi:diguanylate cyclase (GGDEF)-like protein
MIKGVLSRLERASLIAYGAWAVLVVIIVCTTLASLNQVERTETRAILARTEGSAAAAEQTLLRVFDTVYSIRDLALRRQQEMAAGRISAALVLEQQMRDWAQSRRSAIDGVAITGEDGLEQWSSADPMPADTAHTPSVGGRRRAKMGASPEGPSHAGPQAEGRSGLAISRPELTPGGLWTTRVTLPLQAQSPINPTLLVVTLDAERLSQLLLPEEPGSLGTVAAAQRLGDGAFLARSRNPAAAFTEQPAADDPVLLAARRGGAGSLRDLTGSTDRMTGFRVPAGLPIMVSVSVRSRLVLADYFSLRRIALLIAATLAMGALLATRLILANFLLRRRLSQQAMHDPLTSLPNRRYFTDVMPERLVQAGREGATATVLLIDLDGFKYVNDTRGHAVGDSLLREVGFRLRACAGASDTVIRLGGDEFALVRIDRQQRRDATSLARFIIAELSRLYEIDGYQVRVGASVGVAFPPEGGELLPDLLRSADIALYAAKADGGGSHQLFDPGMEETVRSRRALEMDLREALLRQELEVYYQPLVQLDPRRVSGFEALVRWHHPIHGMVMPGRFIPMAEETGLIAGIGQWVLRQACMEATRWPANTRIAVNISPVQFDRSDIVDVVAAALRESRLDPSRLELEITEGVVVLDTGDALATMRRLQALGVRLALDDFGTGYSSLSYLRCFPFDKVKIDGSFLADIGGDGGAIIRAVLSLCTHLNLDTLVEGVETDDQLAWLRDEGCTEAQGHLFSQPQPADALFQIMDDVVSGGAPRSKVVSLFRKA